MFYVLDVDYDDATVAVLDTEDDVVEVHPLSTVVSAVRDNIPIKGIKLDGSKVLIRVQGIPLKTKGEKFLPKGYMEVYLVKINSGCSDFSEIHYVLRKDGKSVGSKSVLSVPTKHLTKDTFLGMYFCASAQVIYTDTKLGMRRVQGFYDGDFMFDKLFPYTLPLCKGRDGCVGDLITAVARKGIGRNVSYDL